MSVSGSSSPINGYSCSYRGTYSYATEDPILNIKEQTRQAQQVLQQQLEALEIDQDISESSIPFLQAYNDCLTVAHYSEQETSAPTNAYKAFIAFKATFHPRYQDLLTFDFDPQRKHLTFKIADETICQLGTSYDKITDNACNCLVYEIASEKFQKAVQSLEDEDRPVGLMAICQPMMEVFQQLLENGSSDAGFDECMPVVGTAYERMKSQLPKTCRDRVQLSVDLYNNSLTFSMSGKGIFKCARPSFSVDVIPTVCELAGQVVSLSFDCGNQEVIKLAARECFMTCNYNTSQKIHQLQALIAALPQTPSPIRAIVIDVPPASSDVTVNKATVTIAAVELHFPFLFGESLPQLIELVEADQQRLMPENDALYESSMQNLRMISGWCEDQLRALAKRKSELTLAQLNALYGDKGEIEQYRQKLLVLQTLIDTNDTRDERVSDGAMKEQLFARLKRLHAYVEQKRNEVITLKQLHESCESEEAYKALEPHAQLMLNITTKPETVTSSAIPHQGAWGLGSKLHIAEQQLSAFEELKRRAPAEFADRLCFHIQKTAVYGKINVSIAIRSDNRNITIAKVSASLHYCLAILGDNLQLTERVSENDLPEIEESQNLLPAQQLIEYINWQLTHPPMSKFEVIKSVFNLKWLCQKDRSYASSNPFQVVDYQVGQTKDTHLFIVVDGQIRASLQYTNAEPEFAAMIDWLTEEDKMEQAFNQASPGQSQILEYQDFARCQAQQKAFELQQLKVRLAEQERIQRQREAELAEMRAQEVERQQQFAHRKLELMACRQEIITKMMRIYGVSPMDANTFFNALMATNLPTQSRAFAALRLFELSKLDKNFEFEFSDNRYLKISYRGIELANLKYQSYSDWEAGPYQVNIRVRKLQESPTQLGEPISMISSTLQKINTQIADNGITKFEIPVVLDEFSPDAEIEFAFQTPDANITVEATPQMSQQPDHMISRMKRYIYQRKGAKDTFEEMQSPEFLLMIKDCGGSQSILGDPSALQYAKQTKIDAGDGQIIELFQLISMTVNQCY